MTNISQQSCLTVAGRSNSISAQEILCCIKIISL